MIAEMRKKQGLSQNKLAKLSGVPQSVICDIESGKTKYPRVDTIAAIAKALGVSIGDLIEVKKAG